MLGQDGTVTENRIAPGALGVRGPRQLAEPEPRVDLLQQQTVSAERLQRAGVQHLRAAHRPREGDQAVHRLPRLAGGRQQRLDGAAADAGHDFVNFIGRYAWVADGRARLRGGRRRPSATSRRRSSAAACTSSPIPRTTRSTQARGRDARREAYHHGGDVRLASSSAASTSTRARQGRPPRLRHRPIDNKGFSRAHRHGAGLAARPAALRGDEVRDRRSRCRPP